MNAILNLRVPLAIELAIIWFFKSIYNKYISINFWSFKYYFWRPLVNVCFELPGFISHEVGCGNETMYRLLSLRAQFPYMQKNVPWDKNTPDKKGKAEFISVMYILCRKWCWPSRIRKGQSNFITRKQVILAGISLATKWV